MIDFIYKLFGLTLVDEDRYDYDEDPEFRDLLWMVKQKLKRSGE